MAQGEGHAPLGAAFLPCAAALAWPRWISLPAQPAWRGVTLSEEMQAPDCSERVEGLVPESAPGLYHHFPATI